MARKVGCHCGGRSECRLCNGTGSYEYQPGPRGWLPFRCPTCDGRGTLADPANGPEPCPTCRGTGTVDPADPPTRGMLDVIWKSLFGA
ncbi:MAG: hypothetical protein K2X87_05840 [Gemmataceae bacterium]|nr:hypothetical protein [Gemmataceae bacterium]